jgi:hypothetical protein
MLVIILVFMALDVLILMTMMFKQYLKIKSSENIVTTPSLVGK